jgi:hypothetical protein
VVTIEEQLFEEGQWWKKSDSRQGPEIAWKNPDA